MNDNEFDWTPFEQQLADRLRKTRGRPTRDCISPEDLIGLVEQGARYPNAAVLQAHLIGCDYCLEELNAVRVLMTGPDSLEVAGRMYAIPGELAPQPSADVAAQPDRTLIDTAGPITVTEYGEVILPGRQKLPEAIVEWVQGIVSARVVQPLAALQETLAQLQRMPALTSAGALRGHSNGPVLLSPRSTAIRSRQPLLRWQGLPRAEGYTVQLGRQADGDASRLEMIRVWSDIRADETELRPDIVLEPGTVYVWQVAATLSDEAQYSDFARFYTLSDEEARQLDAAEQQLPESALLRVGLYAAYGLYEEALAQAEILAKLNPDSPLMEAILKTLKQWSVVSDQWSEKAGNREEGTGNS